MDVVESASDDEDGILRVCNEATGESEVFNRSSEYRAMNSSILCPFIYQLISGLKATSMGCAEEESWKTYV